MRKIFLLILFLSLQSVFADYVDIEIPEINPVENGSEIIPAIDGYELDGTEEKIILPYKKFSFAGRIVKVEILKKKTVEFMMPLKKGAPLYRLSDYKKVKPVTAENMIYPSVDKFFFIADPTLKGGEKQFSLNLYPVIPTGETRVMKIEKVRVHLDGKTAQPMSSAKKDRNSMLILTSELLKSKSKELGNFIDAKRAEGFRVDTVTEKEYEGGDLKGKERAMKIRSFLKTVYEDYFFLLIIADPLPGGKDVPMIVTSPNKGEVEIEYDTVPTDIFYADIFSDIDSNRNGFLAEKADMVQLSTEFIVGRIPFYNGNIEDADRILNRTVRYIKEKPSESLYRKKILFPATIAYYAMQDGQYGMPKMDGAYVAKYLKEKVLDESFMTSVLVESEGGDPSEFTDETPITYNEMLSRWNEGYGSVYWMGHGMPAYSIRTVWLGDGNSNGYPDSYEMDGIVFVDSSMTAEMAEKSPFVFMGSCLNGTVEESSNLAFSVLLNSAVGVVAASQVSYGSIYPDYDLSSQDLFSYGAVFIDAVAANKLPAQVLQEKKETWSNNSTLLTVKFELNYLGDPSLGLNMNVCVEDEECDDGIYCNGTEKCSGGYCERNFDALPCEQDGSSLCKINECDEIQKACLVQNRPDGFYCGDTGDLCFSGKQCLFGECVNAGGKDCSEYNSACSAGICNSTNGLCEIQILNEGTECDDGLFCTENEKCLNGVCQGESVILESDRPCLKKVCDDGTDEYVYLTDTNNNWKECRTSENENGYCHFGICVTDGSGGSDDSSGCSVIIF